MHPDTTMSRSPIRFSNLRLEALRYKRYLFELRSRPYRFSHVLRFLGLSPPKRHAAIPADGSATPFADLVDTPASPIYIRYLPMSISKIQGGQLWKQNGTGEIYLVTRVYNEALSTVAMLRKSGAESEPLVRVRVERTATGQTIPGFTPAQDDENP